MNRPRHYKLIGKLAVPCSMEEWAAGSQYGTQEWTVGKTEVGPLDVSTVFLGLDHSFSIEPDAPAILFETMVFGGEPKIVLGREITPDFKGYQERYATWEEAEAGHAKAVEWAKQQLAAVDASVQLKTSSDPSTEQT
jgi:hypothetical protein